MRRLGLLLAAATLLALCAAPASAGSDQVYAKLGRAVCDWSTGKITDLERLTAETAAAGLELANHPSNDDPPIRCWRLFDATRAESKTKALETLTGRPARSVSATGRAPAVTEAPGLFAFATTRFTVPLPIVQPGRKTNATVRPFVLPPECVKPDPNNDHWCAADRLWGMNRIRAPDLWNAEPRIPVLPLIYKGTVTDNGVDSRNLNVDGQRDNANSVTFSTTLPGMPPAPPNGEPIAAVCTDDSRGATCDHGTHVFGIMGAAWGPRANGVADPIGLVGVAGPASIAACNCFHAAPNPDDPGFTTTYADVPDIASCFRHAAERDAQWVINLSVSSQMDIANPQDATQIEAYRDAIQQNVCDRGGILINSAGNKAVDISDADPANRPGRVGTYPANLVDQLECMLVVAAIENVGNPNNRFASFSNYGAKVLIAAPGENVLSTSITTFTHANVATPVASRPMWNARPMGGTSQASPHVAGAALLLRNAFPHATPREVINCLISTASGVPQDNPDPPKPGVPSPQQTIAGRILDVQAAWACAAQLPLPTCPVTGLPDCVDPASATLATACDPATQHCLPLVGRGTKSVCAYSLLPAGTDCGDFDLTGRPCMRGGGVCNGVEATCPPPRPLPEGTECDIEEEARVRGHYKAGKHGVCGMCYHGTCLPYKENKKGTGCKPHDDAEAKDYKAQVQAFAAALAA